MIPISLCRRSLFALLAYPATVALLSAAAAEADAVDTLADLIKRRLAVMPGVAMNKWNSGTAIEDAPREQQVIDAAVGKAPSLAIDPTFAARFIRAQIEASKAVQASLLLRWTEEAHPPFDAPPDLKTAIRPALDALTPALLTALGPALIALRQGGSAKLLAAAKATPDEFRPAFSIAIAPLLEAARPQR